MNYDIAKSKVKDNTHSIISQHISQLTSIINKFENDYNPYNNINNSRKYIFLHSVTEGMNENNKINFYKKFINLINPTVNINNDNIVIQFIIQKYKLNNDMNEVNNIIESFFGEKMYLENIIKILDYLDDEKSVIDILRDEYELCLSFYIQTAYIYINWVQQNQKLFKNDPHNGRNNEQLISNIWFYITDYLLLRDKVKLKREGYRYQYDNNNNIIDLELLFLIYCYQRPNIDISEWAKETYNINNLHSLLQFGYVKYENNETYTNYIDSNKLIYYIITQRKKVLNYSGYIYIPFSAIPEYNDLAQDIYETGTGGDLISYMNGQYIYIDIKNNWSYTNENKWLIDKYKFFNQIFIYYLFYSTFQNQVGNEYFMLLNPSIAMYFEISSEMYLQYFIITSIINNDYEININKILNDVISKFNGIVQEININSSFPLENFLRDSLTEKINNDNKLKYFLNMYYNDILRYNFDNIINDINISNNKKQAISEYQKIYYNNINIFDNLDYYEQLFLIKLFTLILEVNILIPKFYKNYDKIKKVINDAYIYCSNNNSNSPEYIKCIGNINQTIQNINVNNTIEFINNINNINNFCTLFLCRTCVCNANCECNNLN